MLEVRNLSVKKSGATLLNDISFSLKPGEHLCLAGPNGAGKTTLINALTGGVRFSGEVLYDGQSIKTLGYKTRARFAAVLAQRINAALPFTVYETAALGRYAHTSSSPQENTEKIRDALENVGLLHLSHRAITTLSGGELRRVFLAQTLAQDPQILILDEPVNDLDLKYQKEIFELITQILQTTKKAAITAVHDLSLARAFGTHALLLHEGKQAAYGTAHEVLTNANLDPVYGIDVGQWLKRVYGSNGN